MGYLSQAYLDHLERTGQAETFRQQHTALGIHPDTSDLLFITDVDRQSSMYVPGKAGTGKSSFLETIAAQDIQKGNALIFVDPHGDSVRNIIAQTPQQYMNRMFVLDLEDEDYPFGVNLFADALFESGMDKSKAIARVANIFKVLWPDVLNQANLPIHLNAAIVTLLSNPGTTLVDMVRLFDPRETDFRHQLLRNVTAQDVLDHWRDYEEGGKSVQNEAAALVRRLKLLFMGRDLIKNIVGQRKTSIDFRRAIEQRQIILIKLPVNEATEDAKLIGTFLMSQLTFALFSFGDTEKSQRPGVTIIIDECQNFTTPDFERLITQGRKFGARLVLAHQFRDQLPPFLQKATMGARTIAVFRTSPEDARELVPLFQGTAASVRPEDIETKAAEYLMNHAVEFETAPIIDTFIQLYLLPLQGFRHGHIVQISNTGTDVYGEVLNFVGAMQGFRTHQPVRVDDPLPFLDRLLHAVMRKGDAALPIDPEIPRGFANSGIGFWAKARNCWRDAALQPGFQFPAHLVWQTPEEPQWARRPESPTDMYYHFLFSLRQVMTYLAQYPIGKASASKASEVVQLLSQLPVRHAFVQASDGVWYMRTTDTPKPVGTEMLQARLHFIREQTRQTYCHPRSEVEGKLAPQAATSTDVDPDEQQTLVVRAQPTLQREGNSPDQGRSRWEDG